MSFYVDGRSTDLYRQNILFNASEACPCVDPWQDFVFDDNYSNYSCPSGFFPILRSSYMSEGSVQCVPEGYGANRCDFWDSGDSYISDDACDPSKNESGEMDWPSQATGLFSIFFYLIFYHFDSN